MSFTPKIGPRDYTLLPLPKEHYEKKDRGTVSSSSPVSHSSVTPETSAERRLSGPAPFLSGSAPPLIDPVETTPSSPPRLKPIDENPLRNNRAGFSVHLNQSHPSYQASPQWYNAISQGPNMRGESYQKALEVCKTQMGIPFIENFLDSSTNGHLAKIEEAAQSIHRELGKENPIKTRLKASVLTIQNHAYALVLDPEKNVRYYMRSPMHIFMMRQQIFREKLGECIGKNREDQPFVNKIIDAIHIDQVEQTRQQLLASHPSKKKMLNQLAETAQNLLQDALKDASQEIEAYHNNPRIKICMQWFSKNEELRYKYQMLTRGQYTSLSEMPTGFGGTEKIYFPSYISSLSQLVVACERLQAGDRSKIGFEKYLLEMQKVRHYREKVVPLASFGETLNRILLWPKEYELSDVEWDFLKMNIYYLMGIANKGMEGRVLIPYEYLEISGEKITSERALLKKKKIPLSRKRIACRTLYHDQIPWKALRAIGSLVHGGGSVSRQEANANHRLLREALTDLVRDLPQARNAIQALIDFEMEEFLDKPPIRAPQKLLEGAYNNLHLLGNFEESRKNLTASLTTLKSWYNYPLTSTQFADPKVQYAILRTIQFQGEVTKNIRKVGILGADEIWKHLEELRDLLSHSERESLRKRLIELQNPKNQGLFIQLIADFRTLWEFLENRALALNAAVTWQQRLEVLETGKTQKFHLQLSGLQNLLLFLAQKIPPAKEQQLLSTLITSEARGSRKNITTIVENFLKLQFDQETYEEMVQALPLPRQSKNDVRDSIKSLLSEKAAQNNAQSAKPKMLKNAIKIVENLLKSSKRKCPDDLIKLKEILDACKKEEDNDKLHALVDSAKQQINTLKKIWGQTSSITTSLNDLDEKLTSFVESVEEYKTRKKETLLTILGKIKVYKDEEQVKEGATALLTRMQLGISTVDFNLALDALGIQTKDRGIWEKTNNKLMGKMSESTSSVVERSDETTEFQNVQRLSQQIEDKLCTLDQIIRKNGDQITKDPILFLACQYLISDFRSAASCLELVLETLKYTNMIDPQFIHEIQEALLSCREKGNQILHAHEISEPSALTPYGRRLATQQHIMKLIYHFSAGRNRDISITPLISMLQGLRAMTKKIAESKKL